MEKWTEVMKTKPRKKAATVWLPGTKVSQSSVGMYVNGLTKKDDYGIQKRARELLEGLYLMRMMSMTSDSAPILSLILYTTYKPLLDLRKE